eukprot:scaffold12.g8244.t1
MKTAQRPARLPGARATSAGPPGGPGLLALADDLLERILRHLSQRELQHSVPLTCRRLGELQQRSAVLWQSYRLHFYTGMCGCHTGRGRCGWQLQQAAIADCYWGTSRVPPLACPRNTAAEPDDAHARQAMLRWIADRQSAIRKLTVEISAEGWLETAAQVIFTLRSSLESLSIHTDIWDDTEEPLAATAALLLAVEEPTRLRRLDVILNQSCDGDLKAAHLPRLHRLPTLEHLTWRVSASRVPPGMDALAPRLTSLDAEVFNSRRWLAQAGCLTALRQLSLSVMQPDLVSTEEDLTPLSSLTSLANLAIESASLSAVPTAVTSLPRLTALRLRACGLIESTGALRRLTALRRLGLPDCGLRQLPPELPTLIGLEELLLASNDELRLTAGDLRGLLSQLPALTCLHLHGTDVGGVAPADWLALGRDWPRLRLDPSETLRFGASASDCVRDQHGDMRLGTTFALLLLTAAAGAAAAADLARLDIDGKEIAAQLLHLATFSDDPNPAVTRILFTGAGLLLALSISLFRLPPPVSPLSPACVDAGACSCSRGRPPALQRPPPQPQNDMKARMYVKRLMSDAGLSIREDTMGSIYGRWRGVVDKCGTLAGPGTAASAPAVGTGSHCDAIPLAGAYDGTLGVIGGITALRALSKAGFVPARPLEVVMFNSEEPTRYGLSCSGSRAMAGLLDPAFLDSKRDANGTGFLEAALAAGYGAATTAAAVEGARRTPADLGAFGPLLEAKGLQIGVVTAIAAPAALRVRFSGDGGHAGEAERNYLIFFSTNLFLRTVAHAATRLSGAVGGAAGDGGRAGEAAQVDIVDKTAGLEPTSGAMGCGTGGAGAGSAEGEERSALWVRGMARGCAQLMPLRNDASLAAAELALHVEKAVLGTGAEDTVGTVGFWDISPKAVNSVPREALLEIDVRDTDGARRDDVVALIKAEAARIAARRRVRLSIDVINQDPPAACGAEVVAAVAGAAEQLGYSTLRMVSRAYHDSLFMAQIAPTGMIFVPCRNGWSHRPDEYASPEDMERGVRVLALAMARLAGAAAPPKEEL